ncbi:MAG: AprI/Inh family metalloprotease inhibitor [Hyphomicrobiales bacterium]|jgi:Protease inhibitor Inh|nr:AprI/Inh family metalloprotease inhibitor [Hyphomicrobiales bacterium]MDE2375431.1 AprI/Inh family metalloprotease inhibitor [Hyphomicrobiales bacterium]
MTVLPNMQRRSRQAAIAAAILVVFATVGGCASNPPPEAEAAAAPPAPPPPPPPPPVDLAGRWRFTAVGAGACFMKFGAEPGAIQGTIAPEGGCPGKYFTSRKWTYEHGLLIIRNHKDEPLAQLSFAGDRFQGHEGNLALGLAR